MPGSTPSMQQVVHKEQAIASLLEVREELLKAAAGFSEEDSRQVFLGTWSLLDLLAHLTGWDHANIEAIQAVLFGRTPAFYKYKDHDWQTFNARLVRKYRRESLHDQIALARASHLELAEELGSLPAEWVRQDFGIRFRGYKVTIRRLMEAQCKDDAVHLAQIREFARSLRR